jgi:hypothetical protein
MEFMRVLLRFIAICDASAYVMESSTMNEMGKYGDSLIIECNNGLLIFSEMQISLYDVWNTCKGFTRVPTMRS